MSFPIFRLLVLRFAALYGFWLVLSGRFQTKYLTMGVVCALLVTLFTVDLVQPDRPRTRRRRRRCLIAPSEQG
jgi:multisubunit Na+/H+ antiporter MnhE subunit